MRITTDELRRMTNCFRLRAWNSILASWRYGELRVMKHLGAHGYLIMFRIGWEVFWTRCLHKRQMRFSNRVNTRLILHGKARRMVWLGCQWSSKRQTGRTGIPYGRNQFKSRRDGYGVAEWIGIHGIPLERGTEKIISRTLIGKCWCPVIPWNRSYVF